MKNRPVLLAAALIVLMSAFSSLCFSQGQIKLFTVYSDKENPDSNFFAPSGWMGDTKDITMDTGSTDNPKSGATCIKITYGDKASGGSRWAGVTWQNPANNWGNNPNAGIDLTGIKQLTFWIRGEKGGEVIQEFKVGGIQGDYPDSDAATTGPVTLTTDWQQVALDLKDKDLSHIIGGFGWSTNLDVNPRGCTFYLDDIRFE